VFIVTDNYDRCKYVERMDSGRNRLRVVSSDRLCYL
jgi:hypothetical protein